MMGKIIYTQGVTPMKIHTKFMAIATAALALPLLTYTGTAHAEDAGSQPMAKQEAAAMVPANVALQNNLDARKVHAGDTFTAKLAGTARLEDGTKLPTGTILKGQVVTDDLQMKGNAKMALRFDQAQLKDGKMIPIKATIVGVCGPSSSDVSGNDVNPGDQMPNNWTASTLQVDQIDALPGVDLHSRIGGQASGLFLTSKKSDIKLDRGSELQLALTSANGSNMATPAAE